MALILPDTGAETLPDGRRMVPSAARNAGPILEVLHGLGLQGRLLELASGSGLHGATMAGELGLDWQPTDLENANFPSIRAWSEYAGGVLRGPRLLDATAEGWAAELGEWDAVLLVNLLHLISEDATATVLAEAAAALAPGGTFCIYGPFLRDGMATSPGDQEFDAALRAQDPTVGYKDMDWVLDQLESHELAVRVIEMPANNLMLVAQRA